MRVSTCLLPIYPRREAREAWRRAEDLGFFGAYTYDHLSWREPFRAGPWYDGLLTLAQAAEVTSQVRLGTLVTSPNFRHPVTLASEAVTLDDVASGRLFLGIGAGTDGADAAVLGQEPLTAPRRQDRFEEFVDHLDALLRTPESTLEGEWFTARDAVTRPGPVTEPRVPFGIAGIGRRGLALAARQGQAWITTGDPRTFDPDGGSHTAADSRAGIAAQVGRLEEACHAVGRDPGSIERILLTGFVPETMDSAAAMEDMVAAHAEIGITEVVIHAPIPGTYFELAESVYEVAGALAARLEG